MIHHIVDSFCYIIEILYDLIMLSSIAGVHIKEMRHPVISAILYFCLGTFFFIPVSRCAWVDHLMFTSLFNDSFYLKYDYI